MSAVDAPKPVDQPEVVHVEPATAPVVESTTASAPLEAAPAVEEPVKTDDNMVAPPTVLKDESAAEEKIVEPIYSGALGYKAPGLKK